METNLNTYISKTSIKMVERFNEDLKSFAERTDQDINAVELYEDAMTMFTLSPLRVEDGCLEFTYDGSADRVKVVLFDEVNGKYYEDRGVDGIREYVAFYRRCLKRAIKYWEMDTEELDRMQSGLYDMGACEDEEEE